MGSTSFSLLNLNRHEETLVCFDETIRLEPRHVEARKSRDSLLDFLQKNR